MRITLFGVGIVVTIGGSFSHCFNTSRVNYLKKILLNTATIHDENGATFVLYRQLYRHDNCIIHQNEGKSRRYGYNTSEIDNKDTY